MKSDTVRFYERKGLLPRAARSAADYRIYDDAAVERLRFVRKAQALGFSLNEIGRILSLRGRGKETCRCVVSIAEATLAETKTKLKELQKFRDGLAANLKRWRGQAGREKAAAEFCALIETSGGEASPDGE